MGMIDVSDEDGAVASRRASGDHVSEDDLHFVVGEGQRRIMREARERAESKDLRCIRTTWRHRDKVERNRRRFDETLQLPSLEGQKGPGEGEGWEIWSMDFDSL